MVFVSLLRSCTLDALAQAPARSQFRSQYLRNIASYRCSSIVYRAVVNQQNNTKPTADLAPSVLQQQLRAIASFVATSRLSTVVAVVDATDAGTGKLLSSARCDIGGV
jgi:hypothetical protein